MAELFEDIMQRRSIRRYEPKAVPEDQIEKILEAVRWAPSWANTQCWEVVVVKDEAVKESLRETLPKTNPASKAIAQASVVFALCGRLKTSGYYKDQATTKFGDWFMFDLGIATQNICLAAKDLGLGTVIVGLFDHDKAAEALKLPEGYEAVSLIPVGYPAKDSPVPKRREISEFTHHDHF